MLYIMRHGKTDWNERRKIQGRTDIPLNEEGRDMSENAGIEYKDINFDICYCSPLSRAKETAELVLKGRNVPIITDERLVEMGFGQYEGIEKSFEIPNCPINVLFLEPQNYTTSVGGAESMDELFQRTGEFLREVALPQVESGKDVLIVGHGAMNSAIICLIKELPVKDFWSSGIENCKLMRLI